MSRPLFTEMLPGTTIFSYDGFKVRHGSRPNGNMRVTQTSLAALAKARAGMKAPFFALGVSPVRSQRGVGTQDTKARGCDATGVGRNTRTTTTAADIVADREGAQVNLLGRLSNWTSSPNGCIASVRTVFG